MTLGRLRREIEPVTAPTSPFPVPLAALAPGTQLHGVDGTLQIIRQLQGYEIPAAAWEAEILSPPHRATTSPSIWMSCAFRAK